jgi:prepilin-type N-terminal cleavage/methylation domain-containing protein
VDIGKTEAIMARRGNANHVFSSFFPCGFSLVELLIVVAVIGLLVALLGPALGRSRDQTKLVLCQGHLRNIGSGTLLYAQANNTFLPVDEKLDNPHTGLINALSTKNYVTGPQNYFCPSMTDPNLCFSDANFTAGNISYFYFSCNLATNNRDVSTFLRWTIKWPRLLHDYMDSDTWVASDIWFSGVPTSHSYYKKLVNYATLDGSVQMVYDSPSQKFK